MAWKTYSLSLCIVSMRIFSCGWPTFTSVIVSIPRSRGIEMSSTTRCATRRRRTPSRSSPSAASPITCKPGEPSMILRRPCRTRTWSSARTIRYGAIGRVPLPHWNRKSDPSALPLLASHVELPAEHPSALLHRGESQTPLGRGSRQRLLHVESVAIVFHEYGQPGRLAFHVQRRPRRSRVLGHVGQRFLNDPIHDGMRFGPEEVVDLGNGGRDARPGIRNAVVHEPAKRGRQAEILQNRRSQ